MESSVESLDPVLEKFRDEYLKDRTEVRTYRKLKRYSKFGLYTSGVVIYLSSALYISNDFPIRSMSFISVIVATIAICGVTILFSLNKRTYDYTDKELVFHEVAAVIDTYENDTNNGELSKQINRFNALIVNSDNNILPSPWKNELTNYFEHINSTDEDEFDATFEPVFRNFVKCLDGLDDFELEEIYGQDGTQSEEQVDNQDPGFLALIYDSLDSEYITKEVLVWGLFFLSVATGLLIAFVHGQGWGVLLVTIVFAGLRLYDRRSD